MDNGEHYLTLTLTNPNPNPKPNPNPNPNPNPTSSGCKTLDNGERYLLSNTSVNCDSSLHKAYTPFVVISLLFYTVGILGYYTYLLFTHRDDINPAGLDTAAAVTYRNTKKSLNKMSFLFAAYEPRYG